MEPQYRRQVDRQLGEVHGHGDPGVLEEGPCPLALGVDLLLRSRLNERTDGLGGRSSRFNALKFSLAFSAGWVYNALNHSK